MQTFSESQRWNRLWTLLLLGVGGVGWHWSFEGARTLKPFWTSVEYASVITAFHCLSWALLYSAVPMVIAGRVPRTRGAFLLPIGGVTTVVIICTATFLSWLNLSAGPSLRREWQLTHDRGTLVVGETREARQRDQELKTVLTQTAEATLRLAQDEELHGAMSSKEKKGPFSLALYSLSAAYSDAADILVKDEVTAQENFAEAERLLRTMNDLLAEASAHDDRLDDVNARFARAADQLDKIVGDLRRSPLRSVLAVVKKADVTIAYLPARRDVPQETAAKSALLNLARDSKARIEQLASGADRDAVTTSNRFHVMSREEASMAHIKSFPEYPIICFSVDILIPFCGLLASIVFAPAGAGARQAVTPVAEGEAARFDEAPSPVASDPPSEDANRTRILDAIKRTQERAGVASGGSGSKTRSGARAGTNGQAAAEPSIGRGP